MATVGVGEIGAYAVGSIGSEAAALLPAGQAIANVSGGMAAGGVSGGNIQSALIGAVTAGLQFGVGQAMGHATPSIFGAQAGLAAQKAIAHAAIGCASASASGGSCRAGAASAGFSSLAGGTFGANDVLSRAAIGAVASKLAGGKAEQGALLAAMEFLYNDRGDVMRGELAATRSAFRGFHEYEFDSRCPASECALDQTRAELRANPAPGERRGDATAIAGLGRVNHYDSEIGTMNVTVSSGGFFERHLLRPGSVSRWAEQQGDQIVIKTYGVGWGWLPRINESNWLTGSVWRAQDRAILDRVRQSPTAGKP